MDLERLVKEAPELEMGKELEQIFDKQTKLKYFDSVYKPKLSKKLFLDLMYNVSCCYTLYINVLKLKNTPDLFDENKKMDYLYNFNYYLSLVFSNTIDLLRAGNISTDDILNYYETLLTELKLGDAYFFPDNILQTCMQYARHNNIMDEIYNNPEISLRPSVYSKEVPDNFLKGGRVIQPVFGKILGESLWAINYTGIIAINLLPEDVEGDFEKYQKQLMELWLYLSKLLDLVGHDWDSVGRLYSVYYYSHDKSKKQ